MSSTCSLCFRDTYQLPLTLSTQQINTSYITVKGIVGIVIALDRSYKPKAILEITFDIGSNILQLLVKCTQTGLLVNSRAIEFLYNRPYLRQNTLGSYLYVYKKLKCYIYLFAKYCGARGRFSLFLSKDRYSYSTPSSYTRSRSYTRGPQGIQIICIILLLNRLNLLGLLTFRYNRDGLRLRLLEQGRQLGRTLALSRLFSLCYTYCRYSTTNSILASRGLCTLDIPILLNSRQRVVT